MTLKALMKADVDTVILSTDDFAETIVLYRNGVESSASLVVGVVSWMTPEIETGRGLSQIRTADVLLGDDVTVTTKDAMHIDGQRVEVVWVGVTQDGCQTVSVRQVVHETRGAVPIRTGDI